MASRQLPLLLAVSPCALLLLVLQPPHSSIVLGYVFNPTPVLSLKVPEKRAAITAGSKFHSGECTDKKPCRHGAYCNQEYHGYICECWTTSYTNVKNNCRDKAPVQAFDNSGYMEVRFKRKRHEMNYAVYLRVKTRKLRDAVIAKFVYSEGDLIFKFVAPEDGRVDAVLKAYFIIRKSTKKQEKALKPIVPYPSNLEINGTNWNTIGVTATLNSFVIKLNPRTEKSPKSAAATKNEMTIIIPSVGVTPEKIVLGTEAYDMNDYKSKENNLIGWIQNLFVYRPPTLYDLLSFAKDPKLHPKTRDDFEIRKFPDSG